MYILCLLNMRFNYEVRKS